MERELSFRPRRLLDFWKIEGEKVTCGTLNGSYSMDEIASFIWSRCDGHRTISEMIDDLVQATHMEDSRRIVQEDILKLLREWRDERLIIHNFNPLHAFSEYDDEKVYDLGAMEHNVDILLLVPPSPNPSTFLYRQVHSTFPLGIAMLSAVLKDHGYRVGLANLWLRQSNLRSLVRLLRESRPKVLGVSCMTENFLNGVTIARLARQEFPDIKIVFGGPHVTFVDVETLHEYPDIDVVVRNEGEYALLELMELYIRERGNLERIRGITFRNDREVKRNGSRPLIRNLDELPFPDRAELNLNHGLIGIQTSRGCPGRCVFCVASAMSGGHYRFRSAENVIDEIIYLYHQGARRFFFQDDTFTAHLERLHRILELIESLGLRIEWRAESRVDVVDQDPEIFQKMARTGCTSVQFGVEAGAQETLDKLQKNIQVEQIFRAVRAAREAGLSAVCTMLMGHPFDTPQSIEHSIAFAEQLIEEGASALFSIVVPYPGTKLERQSLKYGLTIQPSQYSDYFVSNAIMDTHQMTKWEIRKWYFDGMRKLIHKNAEKQGQLVS